MSRNMRAARFIIAFHAAMSKTTYLFLPSRSLFELNKNRIDSAAKVRRFLKECFDIFKNIAAIAAFKAFARSVHSHNLAVIGTILQLMIGLYVFSYFDPLTLKPNTEVTNWKSVALLIMAGLAIIAVSMATNTGTLIFVSFLAKLQTR